MIFASNKIMKDIVGWTDTTSNDYVGLSGKLSRRRQKGWVLETFSTRCSSDDYLAQDRDDMRIRPFAPEELSVCRSMRQMNLVWQMFQRLDFNTLSHHMNRRKLRGGTVGSSDDVLFSNTFPTASHPCLAYKYHPLSHLSCSCHL
jgi:hypothetical protein